MNRITATLGIAVILAIAAATSLSPRVEQSEGHQATAMISNIMKTKHDTVKNSISNVR